LNNANRVDPQIAYPQGLCDSNRIFEGYRQGIEIEVGMEILDIFLRSFEHNLISPTMAQSSVESAFIYCRIVKTQPML
jgi:hypothetical protein